MPFARTSNPAISDDKVRFHQHAGVECFISPLVGCGETFIHDLTQNAHLSEEGVRFQSGNHQSPAFGRQAVDLYCSFLEEEHQRSDKSEPWLCSFVRCGCLEPDGCMASHAKQLRRWDSGSIVKTGSRFAKQRLSHYCKRGYTIALRKQISIGPLTFPGVSLSW